MPNLTDLKCVPCRGDSPAVPDSERGELLLQIPEWIIVERDSVPRLERTFRFKNFIQALAFTNLVGELAEVEGHHPLLQTEWGKLKVSWWTHAIQDLHQNDFIMAAKTDELYSGFVSH
jgi:4a-hydroxytetrahydrobiopterin dehydratase